MLFLKIEDFVDLKNQDLVKFDNPRFFCLFWKLRFLPVQRMFIFQEFLCKGLENNTRRVLRQTDDAMRNPNLKRLLSFFTIGKILNIVLHVTDKYKVLIIFHRNDEDKKKV